MKQKICILALCLGSLFSAVAQSVSYHEARKVATRFMGIQQKAEPLCAYIEQTANDTLYYIFNSENQFVVISGDKRCIPVLAYSDRTSFDADDVIPPVKMWLDNYGRQLQQIKQNQPAAIAATTAQWQRLTGNNATKGNDLKSVKPLLSSTWDQGEYYNFYCPKDAKGRNGRAITGCVATAMAQLMHYFRFPDSGEGSYTYEHKTYGTLSADFSQAHYNHSEMVDQPQRINPAISLLTYHCGVAVDMDYGPSASGMWNHKAAYAMRTYFKYSPETEYLYRDSTDLNWDSVLVAHLDRNIPMYYAGWSVPNIDGHGFICDGYTQDADTNYFFHFNFGWNGNADGYFYTNSLYPNMVYNFNLAQEVIINGYPDTTRFTYPIPITTQNDTLTSPAGSIVIENKPIQECPANYTHTWTILPDTTNLQSITLKLRAQLLDGDSLLVNGEPVDATNYNQKFTQWPVEVRLLTGHSDSIRHFDGDYTTTYISFCSTTIIRTGANGTINDGSGDRPYNNYSHCQARIVTANYDYIQIHFNYFRTEKDKDILYVYNMENDSLLAQFSGNMDNRDFSFRAKRLLFIFDTDELNTDEGWELTYSAKTGLEEYETANILVYPNPTSNDIKVKMSPAVIATEAPLYLYDIQGRLLKSWPLTGETTQSLSLTGLPKGLYLLKIGNALHKVVKQ